MCEYKKQENVKAVPYSRWRLRVQKRTEKIRQCMERAAARKNENKKEK